MLAENKTNGMFEKQNVLLDFDWLSKDKLGVAEMGRTKRQQYLAHSCLLSVRGFIGKPLFPEKSISAISTRGNYWTPNTFTLQCERQKGNCVRRLLQGPYMHISDVKTNTQVTLRSSLVERAHDSHCTALVKPTGVCGKVQPEG